MNPTPADRPLVIGHRGAASHAPENTLASFRAGLQAGADWIELDVRLSRDGWPMVIHDATLDRTTNGFGPVAEATREELSALDAGVWRGPEFRGERLPDLAAALAEIPTPARVVVELKAESPGERELRKVVLRVIREAGRVPDVVVSSSRWELLHGLDRIEPGLETALVHRSAERRDPVAAAIEIGARSIHPNHRRLSESLAASAAEAGLAIFPYTVNDEATLRRVAEVGVAGVITDDPAEVIGWLGGR